MQTPVYAIVYDITSRSLIGDPAGVQVTLGIANSTSLLGTTGGMLIDVPLYDADVAADQNEAFRQRVCDAINANYANYADGTPLTTADLRISGLFG